MGRKAALLSSMYLLQWIFAAHTHLAWRSSLVAGPRLQVRHSYIPARYGILSAVLRAANTPLTSP